MGAPPPPRDPPQQPATSTTTWNSHDEAHAHDGHRASPTFHALRARTFISQYSLRLGVSTCVLVFLAIFSWLSLNQQRPEEESVQAIPYLQSSRVQCPDYVRLAKQYLIPYHQPVPRHIQEKADAYLLATQECVKYNFTQGVISKWPEDFSRSSHLFATFETNLRLSMQLYGPLPDVEFWFCKRDWPTLPRAEFAGPVPPRPPLGFCMRGDFHDISVPYKEQDVAGEKEAAKKLSELHKRNPWSHALKRAVWRGSTTGVIEGNCNEDNWFELPRSKLVRLSLDHPDVLDARYAFNSQCTQEAAKAIEREGYGYANMMTVEDYFKYSMLVDVDGNAWSSRFGELLSTSAAVFKQESKYWDWFFPLAEPNKHYVPVKADLSDLIHQLETWSKNDVQLKMLASEAQAFFARLLMPSKQLCYLHVLLREYASLGEKPETTTSATMLRARQ